MRVLLIMFASVMAGIGLSAGLLWCVNQLTGWPEVTVVNAVALYILIAFSVVVRALK